MRYALNGNESVFIAFEISSNAVSTSPSSK